MKILFFFFFFFHSMMKIYLGCDLWDFRRLVFISSTESLFVLVFWEIVGWIAVNIQQIQFFPIG